MDPYKVHSISSSIHCSNRDFPCQPICSIPYRISLGVDLLQQLFVGRKKDLNQSYKEENKPSGLWKWKEQESYGLNRIYMYVCTYSVYSLRSSIEYLPYITLLIAETLRMCFISFYHWPHGNNAFVKKI